MKPRYWVVFMLGAVVLYPLAFGPIMLHRRMMEGLRSWPSIPAFYRPLVALGELSPSFRGVLESYLDLWGVPSGKASRPRSFPPPPK